MAIAQHLVNNVRTCRQRQCLLIWAFLARIFRLTCVDLLISFLNIAYIFLVVYTRSSLSCATIA